MRSLQIESLRKTREADAVNVRSWRRFKAKRDEQDKKDWRKG